MLTRRQTMLRTHSQAMFRAGLLGLTLAAAPLTLVGGFALQAPFAVAAGQGGNGGGNGGGGGGGAHGGGAAGGSAQGGHGSLAAGDHGSAAASTGQISRAAGALNASHASPTALAHAATGSRVGQIATYDRAMLAALALPALTPDQVAARNAAIAAARSQLAASSNKTLTPGVVAVVGTRLGLPPSDPSIGTLE